MKNEHRKDVPYYDRKENIWKCEFPDRDIKEESGSLEYVISEFIWYGLGYHYYINGKLDHEHTFRDVLCQVLNNYNTFSLVGYESEYSEQEIQMINKLIEKLKLVQGGD